MKKIWLSFVALAAFLLVAAAFLQANPAKNEEGSASGSIVGGYRVLSIPENRRDLELTVYRGDYLRFSYDGTEAQPVLSIPDLAITAALSGGAGKAPYFKMQKAGTFAFSLGNSGGSIRVIEYGQANYETVTATQAAELIRNIHPVVLDVRTPGEYREGHLEGAILIPVQQLQKRLAELARFKNENVLIYCATGNRSTVASKILIDSGFARIYNLRHGIHEWQSSHYAVVR